jgi:CO/xanthine dehydrogenase FAD-binding subunit
VGPAAARVKPAPFEYVVPRSLDEALGALGEDAKALAGGQSLVPLLNFRLARPERIVDLNGVDELSYVRRSEGTLRIGALTRQATLERSRLVAAHWPLLTRAVKLVAHPAIRNRGTVGGSVAHADPAAELPVAMCAVDARFHVRSRDGERTIAATDFFQAPLMTALEPDELLVEIEVPAPPPGARAAFAEHARTHGDFALAGAAVVRAGREHAAIALLGAGPTPLRVPDAEAAVRRGASAADAARIAGAELDDDYRRALTTELVRRALEEAA